MASTKYGKLAKTPPTQAQLDAAKSMRGAFNKAEDEPEEEDEDEATEASAPSEAASIVANFFRKR